jgi:hypothetical protein
MGRYISTGAAPANSCVAYTPTTCYQVSQYKYTYDSNECWQNRIIVDTPGSYSFTMPSGTSCCLRVIAVGGGGKVKCTNGNCCGFAGAGGGYSEKVSCVAAGCVVTIVIGRQEQDTTVAYTNSSAALQTITGGGAGGCNVGAASGGDWNSTGGPAGFNCQYCGGSVTHYCGSCIYTSMTTCCGYCVVYTGIGGRNIDPPSEGTCCTANTAGGGSAGSWIWSNGGSGQNAANAIDSQGNAYGAKAGGGGGIGAICIEPMRGSNCSCVCTFQNGYNGGGSSGYPCRKANYPSGVGGGGGTKWQCCMCFVGHTMNGICENGMWRMGPGGWGGRDNDEGREEVMVYHHGDNPNSHNFGRNDLVGAGPSPKRYPWHDIHSMAGSGSAGAGMRLDQWGANCQWVTSGPYPNWHVQIHNSGEGAGTGGVSYYCCEMSSLGMCCNKGGVDAYGTVNWTLLCCLGTSNRVCCADKLTDSLFPYILSCAGTLGGSGGSNICNMGTKAGKGGGAGVYRSYLTCVCWGGTYNLCNGTGPALAFPPCDLDWRVNTAGTGMAIIYWKD